MFRFQSQNIHFGQKVHGAVPTYQWSPWGWQVIKTSLKIARVPYDPLQNFLQNGHFVPYDPVPYDPVPYDPVPYDQGALFGLLI